MSFFVKNKHQNGLKRAKYSNDKNKKRKPTVHKSNNEEITSSEDEDLNLNNDIPDATSSEDENETAQEKKLRLAKVYLKEIEKEEKARLESGEVDKDVISKRLKEDYLKETGRLRVSVADRYKSVDILNVKTLKCREHRKSITCMCISSDDKYVYVGSKDATVIKYSLLESRKIGVIPFVKHQETEITGHTSEILSIAVSYDNKFLAVGDKSCNIQIWDPDTLKHVKTLTGHKSSILGLSFKRDSHTLYSSSKDKTIKVWSLDDMAYVETLFGHQDAISAIDTLYRDRLVSCGGRDLRIFKIPEETQLIYNGHAGNIDNVRLISEENFISGGDDGQICIWSVMRKKPVQCIQKAHGCDEGNGQPFWISSVATLLNTDLVASGSMDGFVRIWKLENGFKSAKVVLSIPVEGFVNCMNFTSDGKYILIATGKEHKFGRWTTVKSAKNCILVVPFVIEN